MSSSCPLLRGTHIPRVFRGGVYLVVYVLFICVYLFHEERASPLLFRFWSLLSYILASPAHLRAFLFYLEISSPGYFDFGVYVIINQLIFLPSVYVYSLDLFYKELISPGYSEMEFT